MIHTEPHKCTKICYKCGKVIYGKYREYDNAPTSQWWEPHECEEELEND